MGHRMTAFIGKNEAIQNLANKWPCTAIIPLPQGYSMIWLTDELFDEVTETLGIKDTLDRCDLCFFSSAISRLMEDHSANSQLAYVETDYFGGVGTQGGVLFQNGKITFGPASGEGTINRILSALGVQKECNRGNHILEILGLRKNPGKDEFDTLELGRYRNNPAED